MVIELKNGFVSAPMILSHHTVNKFSLCSFSFFFSRHAIPVVFTNKNAISIIIRGITYLHMQRKGKGRESEDNYYTEVL